jgi:hypothetical protein
MNKLFNGRKHKPEATQNCLWGFPKFTPSPNLGASPFLLSFPGVEHGNSRDANDKAKHSSCNAKQSKARAQHPPFMVKIIHWARSKDGSIPEMEKGSQRKAEPWLWGTSIPLCKERGPTQTPNLVEPIPYKLLRYHFFKVPHAYGAIPQDTGLIHVAIFYKLRKI